MLLKNAQPQKPQESFRFMKRYQVLNSFEHTTVVFACIINTYTL